MTGRRAQRAAVMAVMAVMAVAAVAVSVVALAPVGTSYAVARGHAAAGVAGARLTISSTSVSSRHGAVTGAWSHGRSRGSIRLRLSGGQGVGGTTKAHGSAPTRLSGRGPRTVACLTHYEYAHTVDAAQFAGRSTFVLQHRRARRGWTDVPGFRLTEDYSARDDTVTSTVPGAAYPGGATVRFQENGVPTRGELRLLVHVTVSGQFTHYRDRFLLTGGRCASPS